MSGEIIPLEQATNFAVQQMVASHLGMQAFMETLDSEQQRRFMELAHHIYHEGTEDGMARPRKAALNTEQLSKVLAYETDLFLQGATIYRDELGEGD